MVTIFDALELAKRDVAAIVGGGGKTSIMFALGREAEARGLKTVITTTTRIYRPDHDSLPVILTPKPEELFIRLQGELTGFSLVTAGADLLSDGKIVGLEPGCISEILRAGADLVIVEADGAAHKPFKAPASHEPIIPDSATVVVPVVGIDCLDQPLRNEYVHRPQLVAELAGVKLGDTITPEVVAKVATHPLGYLKGLPKTARWILFINKVETNRDMQQARKIAELVGRVRPCRVIIGRAKHSSPVTEILEF